MDAHSLRGLEIYNEANITAIVRAYMQSKLVQDRGTFKARSHHRLFHQAGANLNQVHCSH